MAKAEIFPGPCGFTTIVYAEMDGSVCRLRIESECECIKELADEMDKVHPFNEISFRNNSPRTLELGSKYCAHTACPVPIGIIKAVEVAAGLNLPVDVNIKLSK